jgi:hypothetical protein
MTPTMTTESLYDETLMALAKGKSTKSAMTDLIGKGLPELNARMLVEEADKVKRAAFRKAGAEAAAKGALYVVIGIAVTAGTYAMGLPIFFIAWGPVIFGGITMIKGLYRMLVG